MRFTEEIFQEYKRFTDEQRHLEAHKERDKETGKKRLPFWGEMGFDEFNRLCNTLTWLQKFNSPLMRLGEIEPVKPTTEAILEVAERIGRSGAELRVHAKQYQAVELKQSLQRQATNQIKCGSYYKELAESGFYDDKELTYADKDLDRKLQEDRGMIW